MCNDKEIFTEYLNCMPVKSLLNSGKCYSIIYLYEAEEYEHTNLKPYFALTFVIFVYS